MSTDRLVRKFRVQEAAAMGIRVVPADPDPREFPPVPFACEVRPVWCDECTMECPYGVERGGAA